MSMAYVFMSLLWRLRPTYCFMISGVVTCWRHTSSGVSRNPKCMRLTRRIVVLLPTCFSKPLAGAMLKRKTASCWSISGPSSHRSSSPALPTTAQVLNLILERTSWLGMTRSISGVTFPRERYSRERGRRHGVITSRPTPGRVLALIVIAHVRSPLCGLTLLDLLPSACSSAFWASMLIRASLASMASLLCGGSFAAGRRGSRLTVAPSAWPAAASRAGGTRLAGASLAAAGVFLTAVATLGWAMPRASWSISPAVLRAFHASSAANAGSAFSAGCCSACSCS
mmetsp:Transcript_6999/g.24328  ORF Transcript_6999/g.24328 Transcript_6999/m.24328 type:complete len:283 (-) Transcript_6999:91-939(-)